MDVQRSTYYADAKRKVIIMDNATNIRVYVFAIFVLLAVLSMGYRFYTNGSPVFLGIDFAGGTRIPILLERPVDSATMEQIVDTIKKRASSYALTEARVRALGSDELVVELPSSNEEYVSKVEEILSSKGVFIGVIDGTIAVSGDEIYQGTIHDTTAQEAPERRGSGPGFWSVGFSVTEKGKSMMANAAFGKPNYPVYMFLDRPTNAVILIPKDAMWKNVDELKEKFGGKPVTLSDDTLLNALRDAMKLEGDDIPVYILEDNSSYQNIKPLNNKTVVLVPDTVSDDIVENLKNKGFKVEKKPYNDFIPNYEVNSALTFVADEWPIAGLMNAPGISPDMTHGTAGYSYTINGEEKGGSIAESVELAKQEKKKIMSILKGGALPVQISLGNRTIIPAPLGGKFLEMSLFGALGVILAIAVFVGIRYKKPKVIIGLLLTSLGEVLILVSIIGAFSIDLGAMAGIIAAIGTSVDSEVVITDELLSKKGNIKDRVDRAFQIVMTTGGIAVITMLPLLFSGLTEIIGFAISTMTGTLIGMFISRHAYAYYVRKVVLKE